MKSFMNHISEVTNPKDILTGLMYHTTRKKALSYAFIPSAVKGKPLSYTVADRNIEVVTRLSDGIETKNTAREGDLIFTGVSGERYVIRAAKVSSLYNGSIGGTLVVAPSPRRVARYTGKDTIRFKAPWGEDMILKSGDYVVQDGTGHYRIAKREFELTYERIP